MKKYLVFLFLTIISQIIVRAEIPLNYYNSAEGLNGSDLKKKLNEIISGHLVNKTLMRFCQSLIVISWIVKKSFLSIRGGQTQYLIAVPLDGTVSICGQIHMESIELDPLTLIYTPFAPVIQMSTHLEEINFLMKVI